MSCTTTSLSCTARESQLVLIGDREKDDVWSGCCVHSIFLRGLDVSDCIESEWHPWLFRRIPHKCYNVTHSLGRTNTHRTSGRIDYNNNFHYQGVSTCLSTHVAQIRNRLTQY